jgi:hypothetical protein
MTDDLVSKVAEFMVDLPDGPTRYYLTCMKSEIERLQAELKEADRRSFQAGRICYRGFNYGVGSQVGIDSLRSAIRSNGHD